MGLCPRHRLVYHFEVVSQSTVGATTNCRARKGPATEKATAHFLKWGMRDIEPVFVRPPFKYVLFIFAVKKLFFTHLVFTRVPTSTLFGWQMISTNAQKREARRPSTLGTPSIKWLDFLNVDLVFTSFWRARGFCRGDHDMRLECCCPAKRNLFP